MPITEYPPTQKTDAEEINIVDKGLFFSHSLLKDILTEMKIHSTHFAKINNEKFTKEDIED